MRGTLVSDQESSGMCRTKPQNRRVNPDRDDLTCDELGDTLSDEMIILGHLVLHEYTWVAVRHLWIIAYRLKRLVIGIGS